MYDTAHVGDAIYAALGRARPTSSVVEVEGIVVAELRGPTNDVIAVSVTTNLVTQIGDEYYGERAAGIASPPAQVTGMKLGTGSTAPAKTGAGAALTTYLANSDQAINAGYPQSALAGSARQITWQAIWVPGKATSAVPVTEVVLVNDTLTDATSPAASTISRALLTGIPTKGVDDTLTVTWHHNLLGAP